MNALAAKNQEDKSNAMIQLVTFRLLEEKFGLPILETREIIRMTKITPVPNAPSFVEGVINLRGQILPVVDLRKRFGITSTEANDDTRIVVIEVGNSTLGLIVDVVHEVLTIAADSISPPPQILSSGIGAEYIRGIGYHGEEMLVLINIKKVFTTKEIEDMGHIGE